MSSSENDQNIELKIQKDIREAEDDLVTWIQSALDNEKSYDDLEESQFRNLLRVAETTESPEVVKNFLLYQVGRDKKWGRGEDSLAHRIIADINTRIEEKAKKITDSYPDKLKKVKMELIRRYLGYGARHLKYLNFKKSEKKSSKSNKSN